MEHFYQTVEGWFTFPGLYKKIVNEFPTGSHFVEVGSFLGRSLAYLAVEVKNSNKQITIDCVDTWLGSDVQRDPTNPAYHPATQLPDGLYTLFLKNIEPIKNMVKSLRMTSLEAANLYENESLDFVFIDADHVYEEVKKDIKAWYPKVKKGGILAGHDYKNGWEGVEKAVNEFLIEHNYTLEPDINGHEMCWGIRKKQS